MKVFDKSDLGKLYKPDNNSSGEDNGQITIIGGSSLFHGAPLLALKTASRIVDMVFFTSSEPSVGKIAEQTKSKLMSFIWVPWDEVDAYIEKSDAVLIGPGMMRYGKEIQNLKFKIKNYNSKFKSIDNEGEKTRKTTERLLKKFPHKRWVIDAGSLQTMDAEWIPPMAIITPNSKELEMLFKIKNTIQNLKYIQEKAKEHKCVIVAKGPETVVCSPEDCVLVKGGNAGLTKGGSGDVLAGLTAALLAKNDPLLSACAASYIEKAAADDLYKKVGVNYNMDDLADIIPETLKKAGTRH